MPRRPDQRPCLPAPRHHGYAARAFIERLVSELNTDPDRLRRRIADLCARFIFKAAVGGNKGTLLRRAQAFSVLFATGRLASDWGIIPVKQVLEPLLVCFRRSLDSSSPAGVAEPDASQIDRAAPLAKIKAYVAENRAALFDLDEYNLPKLSDKKLDSKLGFLKTIKSNRYLLLRSGSWNQLFGTEAIHAAKSLKASGRLLTTEGFQTQVAVRVKVSSKGIPTRSAPDKDRVYAILFSE